MHKYDKDMHVLNNLLIVNGLVTKVFALNIVYKITYIRTCILLTKPHLDRVEIFSNYIYRFCNVL